MNLCDPWTRLASSGVALLLAGSVTAADLIPERHDERHAHSDITYVRPVDLEPEHDRELHTHTDMTFVRTVDNSSIAVTGAALPSRPSSWQPTGDAQQLSRRLAELAVDEVKADIDTWTIEVSPYNIVISAATSEVYRGKASAWEGARRLWRVILDLGYELTDEGHSALGTIRRLDRDSDAPRWRGIVRMVLKLT